MSDLDWSEVSMFAAIICIPAVLVIGLFCLCVYTEGILKNECHQKGGKFIGTSGQCWTKDGPIELGE